MKYSKLLLAIVLFQTLCVSCNSSGPVFEKYLKMKNSTWDRFDQKLFQIQTPEPSEVYDITMVVRCTERFNYDNFPAYAILFTPSGEERIREVKVAVRENGKLITDSEAGKPQASIILWKSISLGDKGIYKISIESMIPKIQTEGIDEIGIVVVKAKE
jgi:gliding motility-associated lipoprotein GldH